MVDAAHNVDIVKKEYMKYGLPVLNGSASDTSITFFSGLKMLLHTVSQKWLKRYVSNTYGCSRLGYSVIL